MSGSKYHICSSSPFPKAALALRQETLIKVSHYSIEEYPCQDFACNAKERDSSMVITCLAVALPLLEMYYSGILEVLWNFLLSPHLAEQLCEFCNQSSSSKFVDLSRNGVSSRGFATR